MKRLLTLFAAISMLFVAGCGGDDYDDTAIRNEITDLANRVAKLEQLCQQMNTNISSLQTIVNALQQNDFITAVVPVTQGGKVIGYTITFSRSGAITIYHGTDGADGKDGKDGSTPQVSVKKDTNGIYYWTLNGEWLTDEAGNKIQAEGKDGADGSNGNDGADGITPQLKIEENYWYISYDGGATWTQLGKAVGEDGADGSDGSDGKDGVDGENGDSIFSGVSQDDEFVYFHLSDGTMITLPKHDKENIQFEDLNVKVICCKNWDTNNDGELSYDEAAAVTDLGTTFKGNTNIIAFNELKYFTGLTTIASSAFEGCTNLWKVQLPDTVEIIGTSAFAKCTSLIGVIFPNSVTTIESSAFSGCSSIKEIIIPEPVQAIGKNVFEEAGITSLLLLGQDINIGEYAFTHTSLEKVVIKGAIAVLGNYAFFENSQLQEVVFEEDVVKWGGYAFANCPLLHNIQFGATLTKIGFGAFADCVGLETLVIPNNVNTITCRAFVGCSSLESIYCIAQTPAQLVIGNLISDGSGRPRPQNWDDVHPFKNVATTVKIYVPTKSLELYANADVWSDYYSDILIGYDFEENPHSINSK